jgi:hypothetical protein
LDPITFDATPDPDDVVLLGDNHYDNGTTLRGQSYLSGDHSDAYAGKDIYLIAFDGIALGDPIARGTPFIVYDGGWTFGNPGDTLEDPNAVFDIGNVVSSGSVIPEPSTALIAVLGGMALIRRRNRG